MEPTGVLTAGFSLQDMLLLALVAVILFGGKKVGELGKGLGEGIRSFKDALKGDEQKKEEEKVALHSLGKRGHQDVDGEPGGTQRDQQPRQPVLPQEEPQQHGDPERQDGGGHPRMRTQVLENACWQHYGSLAPPRVRRSSYPRLMVSELAYTYDRNCGIGIGPQGRPALY